MLLLLHIYLCSSIVKKNGVTANVNPDKKTKPEYYPFKLTLHTGQTIEMKIKMNEITKISCGYPKHKIQVFQYG